MPRKKKEEAPFTYSISYWNGERAVPTSEMSDKEHRRAATLAFLRFVNSYSKPNGYKVFSPEMPDT